MPPAKPKFNKEHLKQKEGPVLFANHYHADEKRFLLACSL